VASPKLLPTFRECTDGLVYGWRIRTEHLPVRTASNAQFRDVLKGRLATGELSATTLVKEISVSKAIENLEAAQPRDDTQ